jgi:hypothetical protein
MEKSYWVLMGFFRGQKGFLSALMELQNRRLDKLSKAHHELCLKIKRLAPEEKQTHVERSLIEELRALEEEASFMLEERADTGETLNAILSNSIAKSSAAPRLGERILLLVLRTKEERVNIPGDLEEEYRGIAAKHGARYAKLWYYKQVVASAWPMVRKAVKWGALAWASALIRRSF